MLCTKEDTELYSKTLLHDKYEYRANCIAVRLLLPYYLDGLDEIEQVNVNDFMKMFELTNDMYDACVKIMKNCIAA
ncbi:hypothetical protein [Fructilactobacillus lindneri]|uniref:hypothetical protein n=1 Tax=Fructilactobacillus lindneri TaxID=53444 RepID=UPI000CD41F25|nr:hypothetical protein BGL33_06985 [Fructilactobacillus lindneri]